MFSGENNFITHNLTRSHPKGFSGENNFI